MKKFNRHMRMLFVLFLIVFSLQSCDKPFDPPETLNDNHYSFISLDYPDLYYNYSLSFYEAMDPFDYVMDEDSVIITQYKNIMYYNPVALCLRGLNYFDRYMNMRDSLYLDLANRHRDRLIELMDENYLFEYQMNYNHYDIVFMDPWYSGMAQGLALSMLSRMAACAQDSISEDLAHNVFQTLNPYSLLSPEVVDVDKLGYAWIEEYPGNPPDRTFNGFMHAIIGIYDYYHLVNSDQETADILSAYLTTIEAYMREYRNPDGISYYCLKHHHIDRTYHKIHVWQLDLFTDFTQDSSFALFADTLETDYWDW